MTKKQIVTASTAAALLLASATLAFAQTTSTTTAPAPAATSEPINTSIAPIPPTPIPAPISMPPRKEAKNMVQIGPEGNALIRGTVNAVGTDSVTVNSWGGMWTINIGTDAQVMPKSTNTLLGMIKPGDFVDVNGNIDTAQLWTVKAKTVRDTDAEQNMAMAQKQMRMQVKQMQEKMKQNIQQIKKTGKDQIRQERQNMKDARKQMMPTRKPGTPSQNTATTPGQNGQ